jgi:hypothetical protein
VAIVACCPTRIWRKLMVRAPFSASMIASPAKKIPGSKFASEPGFSYKGVSRTFNQEKFGMADIAVRLRSNKKVQNLSKMWYEDVRQTHTTQGDFGLEPP